MDPQHLRTAHSGVLSDPEWIALESLDEETRHFIFDDALLQSLSERGLVEPKDDHWRITRNGQDALNTHNA
jgi:coproporphyrinogen III oxidase-like Fe-S oxidoreductase